MKVWASVLLISFFSASSDSLSKDYDEPEESLKHAGSTIDFSILSKWLDKENGDKGKVEEEELSMSIPNESLCPPPIQPVTPELCNRTVCSSAKNCSDTEDNVTRICCFNGCVETCMRPLDPPQAFDWIKETPDIKKFFESNTAAHSSPAEMMVIQGGCLVTPLQYIRLEVFKKNEHISHCFCDSGGVFCKINESK